MYIIAGPITPLLGICPMDLCDYEKKVQRYSLLNLEGGKKTPRNYMSIHRILII